MEYQNSGRSLQKNHGNAIPRHIIAFDTETLPEPCGTSGKRFRHRFRLGCAISGQYRRGGIGSKVVTRLQCCDDFWALVEGLSGAKHTLWVVAHNALFDLITIGMPAKVSSGEYVLRAPRSTRKSIADGEDKRIGGGIACLESPPFILTLECVKTGGRIAFVDTMNWFRSTLAELGESVSLAKLDMPRFDECDDCWYQYCQRDTEIVFKAFTDLIRWQRENNLGVFRYTAASQAMGGFRHRFMPCEIHYHDNTEVKRLERDGFIGGRTECFRIGHIDGDVYQLDVNSLYPSVMQCGLFPRRLNVFELDPTPKPLPDLGGWQRCVAEVDIETDKPIYPFRTEDVTIYPTGSFRTVLSGVELDHAVRAGHAKTVGRWAKYKLAPLFKTYVTELWQMRSNYKTASNIAYADFCKIMLNSLFGKFAQRPIKWVLQPDRIECLDWHQWCELDWETKRPIMYRCIGGNVYCENQQEEREDTLIAISAFVASAARVVMNQYREIAGVKNVYYQGVDGLLVSRNGYDRLLAYGSIDDNAIGKLRLQRRTNDCHIYNCSDYRIGTIATIAGRTKPTAMASYSDMGQRRFSGPEALFSPGTDKAIYERIVEWRRKGEYRKGDVMADGWVEPFIL